MDLIAAIVKAVLLTASLNAFFIVPFLHYCFVCDFQIHHMHFDITQTAISLSQMFSSTFVFFSHYYFFYNDIENKYTG